MSEPLQAVAIDLREIAAAIEEGGCGGCDGDLLPTHPENISLSLIVKGENGLIEV